MPLRHPRKQVPPHSKENDFENQAIYKRELEEHYENDHFHTTETYSISEECVTYSAVMDTDDGKHYAVRYYVPHKPGKIRFHEDDYLEVYPTPALDLRIGYSLEENQAEANITPECLPPDQRNMYIRMLEDALRKLKSEVLPSGLSCGEREEK